MNREDPKDSQRHRMELANKKVNSWQFLFVLELYIQELDQSRPYNSQATQSPQYPPKYREAVLTFFVLLSGGGGCWT